MKRVSVLCLTLIFACTSNHAADCKMSCFTKTALWCIGSVGATVALGLLGKKIYNRYKTLSDAQEIRVARDLFDQTELLIVSASLQYENELALLAESFGKPAIDDAIIAQLKEEISRGDESIFAFLHFKLSLDSAIETLRISISNLGKKRSHLVERKEQLLKKQISPALTEEDRNEYIQHYDALCVHLTEQRETLLNLCGNLKRIRRIVIGMDEYKKSLVLSRLNRLELKLDTLAARLSYTPLYPCSYQLIHRPSCCRHDLLRLAEQEENWLKL